MTSIICTETSATHDYDSATYETMCQYGVLIFLGRDQMPALPTEGDAEWWHEYERVAEDCEEAAEEQGVDMGDVAERLGVDWSDLGAAMDKIAEALGVQEMFATASSTDADYRFSQDIFDFLFDRAYEAYERYRELMKKAAAAPDDGDYNLLSDFHSYHNHLLEFHEYRRDADHAYGVCEGICGTLDVVRGPSWDDDEDTTMELVRDKYERIHGSETRYTKKEGVTPSSVADKAREAASVTEGGTMELQGKRL